jgi:hypothetical protein
MSPNANCSPLAKTALRSAVEQTLPLADSARRKQALARITQALEEYESLKSAAQRQLTAEQIRRELTDGYSLFSRAEKWMAKAQLTAVRDYVLTAMSDGRQDGMQIEVPWRAWETQIAKLQNWNSWVSAALLLVKSDRGRPESFPLNLLVQDLAKIWKDFSALPFTRSRKGRQQPRLFVAAICRIVEPQITDAEIETAIKHAVRKLPRRRRGRK